MQVSRSFLLPFTLALVAAGCGSRGVVLQTPSPDRQQIAEVRSHWSLDPPSQSLWIQTEGEAPRKLVKLGEDSESCWKILWGSDSSRVAFLINGVRLDIYDVKSAALIKKVPLIPPDQDPWYRSIRDVRFSAAEDAIEFHDCPRSDANCQSLRRVAL
jgi:hypothetical protein